jgi:hypothetical protein
MAYPCTECIIDLISSSGPQDKAELRRECRTQAVPYSESCFLEAIIELTSTGKIIVEPNDGDPYFDFPESYYTSLT